MADLSPWKEDSLSSEEKKNETRGPGVPLSGISCVYYLRRESDQCSACKQLRMIIMSTGPEPAKYMRAHHASKPLPELVQELSLGTGARRSVRQDWKIAANP